MARITNDYCTEIVREPSLLSIRKNMIEWNASLKEGTKQKPQVFVVWKSGEWKVGIIKPGLYSNTTKPGDFKPAIWHNNERLLFDETFNGIYGFCCDLYKKSEYSLFIFLCILVRDAFSQDYIKRSERDVKSDSYQIKDNKSVTNKLYKYEPNPELVKIIKDCSFLTEQDAIPITVYLQYIALIAVDEDVSYYNSSDYYRGKVNNLLSYLDIIPGLNKGSNTTLQTRRTPVKKSWDSIIQLLLKLSTTEHPITVEVIENIIFPEGK